MLGLDTATGEIALVFFTTLAPSGILAFMIMAAALLRGIEDDVRTAIMKMLCIPLIVAMVGLVASATHLGNPSNALYVLMGVGRSPLSNEVFAAVVFFALAGSFWLYSFTLKRRRVFETVWLVLIIVAGAAAITGIALAYSVDTIVTWDSTFVPVMLWLNALVGGPVLALLSLSVADGACVTRGGLRALVALSAVALGANVVFQTLYGIELSGMRNSIAAATDLVPWYPGFVIALAALGGAGIVLCASAWHAGASRADASPATVIDRAGASRADASPATVVDRASASRADGFSGPDTPHTDVLDSAGACDACRHRRMIACQIGGCVLVFAGIFVVRFGFYMLHMTVGLAI